jgi:hypothetical protein
VQFFDLYEIAAKHLKKCFPHLKIGGPALAYEEWWADLFLMEMQKRGVELDFFSWHIYANEPNLVVEKAERMRAFLDKYGYTKTESILNEWNYVRGWTDEFVYTIEAIHGAKGASFLSSVMAVSQQSSIDMLMYYDTRPSVWNGAFDYYTYRRLKGYYPLRWYSDFYGLQEVRAKEKVENIYSLCGVDEKGRVTAMISYFSDNDDTPNKQITLDFGKDAEYEVYLVDKEHNGELYAVTRDLTFDLSVHSIVFIKEK